MIYEESHPPTRYQLSFQLHFNPPSPVLGRRVRRFCKRWRRRRRATSSAAWRRSCEADGKGGAETMGWETMGKTIGKTMGKPWKSWEKPWTSWDWSEIPWKMEKVRRLKWGFMKMGSFPTNQQGSFQVSPSKTRTEQRSRQKWMGS